MSSFLFSSRINRSSFIYVRVCISDQIYENTYGIVVTIYKREENETAIAFYSNGLANDIQRFTLTTANILIYV